MPHYRCCVGGCDNDNWYPQKYVIRSHVQQLLNGQLKFHYMTRDKEKRTIWEKNIRKGREFVARDHHMVCSNHFEYAKPTFQYPNPTLYLTESDKVKKSPVKRRRVERTPLSTPDSETKHQETPGSASSSVSATSSCSKASGPCLTFEQLTRDSDVRLFTGFQNTACFSLVFEFLQPSVVTMVYWKGTKQMGTVDTERDRTRCISHGNRKLKLEEEFFMVMQRIRLGLLTEYLAHIFKVSPSVVSSVIFSWLRLMALDLRFLISWPNRIQVSRNLPDSFRKYYKKCRVIIDCTEFFIETPSSLEAQALCWSEYKHHSTIKVLVGITPNGCFSYISDCYGGKASDKFIVEDSGFLKLLQPGDQVMADRGFHIQDLLAFYQCTLAIPPSSHTTLQMSGKDVRETSKIANVRIYVECAIRRLKEYQILKNELPVSLLPVADDLITICAALTNLKNPLAV